MRLIDADAAIALIKQLRNKDLHNHARIYACNFAMSILGNPEQTPTINPEDCSPEWISVEDRLPEYEHPVLATDVREDYTAILTLKAGGKVLTDCWEDAATGVRWPVDEMTHWMPLPVPPKEKMNGKEQDE